jgi:hypothetical protein
MGTSGCLYNAIESVAETAACAEAWTGRAATTSKAINRIPTTQEKLPGLRASCLRAWRKTDPGIRKNVSALGNALLS